MYCTPKVLTIPEEGTVLTPSPMEKDIITIVQIYFGDIQIRTNEFLMQAGQQNDGWISIDELTCAFGLGRITTDSMVIACALRKSTSGLIQVSDDNERVRRNINRPIPEDTPERRAEISRRTIYAQGFSVHTTNLDLLAFFSRYGDVEAAQSYNYIDMETGDTRFHGCLFVTYKTNEQAAELVSLRNLLYRHRVVKVMFKEQFRCVQFILNPPTGATLRFVQSQAENIKDELYAVLQAKGAKVGQIVYNSDNKTGVVRLMKPYSALKHFNVFSPNQITINGTRVFLRILFGSEERAHMHMLQRQLRDRYLRRRNRKLKCRDH